MRRVTPEFRSIATEAVLQFCDGRVAALTDGATSALAQALRIALPRGGLVALPGFGCVDLLAAAMFAKVSVVTYDIDPATLNPEPESVRRAIADGAGAIVIAPLLGFPIDVGVLRSITTPAGVPIIEDAAQGAGGTWQDRNIGSFGDISVLSFGRGKGTSTGRGGALVSRHADYDAPVRDLAATVSVPDAGWRDWMVSVAVWALARPTLYAIPASLPSLRLGEMVFHEAHAPRAMTQRAVAMLSSALRRVRLAAMERGVVAAQVSRALQTGRGGRLPTPIEGGTCGWLRLPLLDERGRGPSPSLGILRSYPLPIRVMPEGRSVVMNANKSEPGADLLARTLLTVPTHRFVTRDVVDRIGHWATS